jgi:hypothetical protein
MMRDGYILKYDLCVSIISFMFDTVLTEKNIIRFNLYGLYMYKIKKKITFQKYLEVIFSLLKYYFEVVKKVSLVNHYKL